MAEAKSEVGGLLDRFAVAASFDARLVALAELMKKRVLHAVRDDPRLGAGIDDLVRLATDSRAPDESLRAIAALARIGTIKSLAGKIGKQLAKVLENPLPTLAILKDPDDRYYVATALHQATPTQDWILDYAATEVVEEKQAEKSRQELVLVLFKRATTLAQVFHLLVTALKRFRPETKNPGDSVAKRLERILVAIRPQAVSVLIEPGSDTGQCLQDMLRAAFAGAGSPETPEVAKKTVEEIAGLLHDIARTQISLVAEPSLYAALDTPKMWFSPPEWRYIAEKSANLQLVTRDIRDALTLLAKQGATDRDLFDQLVKASGSREAAVRLTVAIAEQHPELATETRDWLQSGGNLKRRQVLGGLEESQALAADPLLATLMMDSCQLSDALTGVSDDARAELRLLEPSLAEPLDCLVARCRTVLNGVDALAGKRRLCVDGRKGEAVDYSPTVHELIGGHIQGVRRVKIVQPMIVRERVIGTRDVIRKALVEKI